VSVEPRSPLPSPGIAPLAIRSSSCFGELHSSAMRTGSRGVRGFGVTIGRSFSDGFTGRHGPPRPRHGDSGPRRCTTTLHARLCTHDSARTTLHARLCTLDSARSTLHARLCTLDSARSTLHLCMHDDFARLCGRGFGTTASTTPVQGLRDARGPFRLSARRSGLRDARSRWLSSTVATTASTSLPCDACSGLPRCSRTFSAFRTRTTLSRRPPADCALVVTQFDPRGFRATAAQDFRDERRRFHDACPRITRRSLAVTQFGGRHDGVHEASVRRCPSLPRLSSAVATTASTSLPCDAAQAFRDDVRSARRFHDACPRIARRSLAVTQFDGRHDGVHEASVRRCPSLPR